MKIADRNDNCMALFFIDLDRFKQINDSLGHESGDQLLKTVARRLVKVVRKQDTLARLGGNEFVVLLESFETSHSSGKLHAKLLARFHNSSHSNREMLALRPVLAWLYTLTMPISLKSYFAGASRQAWYLLDSLSQYQSK